MLKPVYQWMLIIFSIFWIGFLLLDYLNKHDLFLISATQLPFGKLILAELIVGGAAVFLFHRNRNSEKVSWLFTGAFMLLFCIFHIVFSVSYYFSSTLTNYGFSDPKILSVLGITFFISGTVFLLVAMCYGLGDRLWNFISPKSNKKASSLPVKLALGITAWTFVLFFLGLIGQLNQLVVLLLVVFLVVLHWQPTLSFLKNLFFTPFPKRVQLNYLGLASFYLLLLFIVLNIIRIISPVPTGSDALNYYLNLSSLLADYQQLVVGFQPYNWSLFQASGLILTGNIASAMLISSLGAILSLVALEELAHKRLKIDLNVSWFLLLTFYLVPTVAFQSISELKIDLGLLFIQISILIIFLRWVMVHQKSPSLLFDSTLNNADRYMIILGILLGFALGTKITTLFLIFGLFTALLFVTSGFYGFLGGFLFSIGMALILKLDASIDLRPYHLSVVFVQWFALSAGIALLSWNFYNKKEAFFSSLRPLIIFSLFAFLTFLPWLIKNGVETRSLNPNELLTGKRPGVEINATMIKDQFDQILNGSKK